MLTCSLATTMRNNFNMFRRQFPEYVSEILETDSATVSLVKL